MSLLPNAQRTRLASRPALQAALENVAWLFLDRILRLGVGLLVGIWVARYLGPEQFGMWNYAAAFAALFGAIASLGLDTILVRDLVHHPDQEGELLGTAFALRLATGTASFLACTGIQALVQPGNALMLLLVALSAGGYLFQPGSVIDAYFQAKLRARQTVLATNAAFLVATLARVGLLTSAAGLLWFARVGLGETVLAAAFLGIGYLHAGDARPRWHFSAAQARRLLQESWPLMLSGVAITLYMRIDQVMIGQFRGASEVGQFSAAVRISEVWYFVPVAIVNSAFPAILAQRKPDPRSYARSFARLLSLLALLAILMGICMSFASSWLVGVLYGPRFAPAAVVLSIHIWAGVFVALGLVSGNWLVAEGLQRYTLYRSLSGGIANVLLNLLLIPRYGIQGAAVATVISYGISVFWVGFHARCRPLFLMMCQALFPVHLLSRSRG